MKLHIEIDADSPEFCCGRAGGTAASVLVRLATNPIFTAWNGHTPLELPITTYSGNKVGKVIAVDSKTKPV